MTRIRIDDREKGPQRAALLEAFPEAEVLRMDVADYILGESHAFEFKEIGDLAQDMGMDLFPKLDALDPFPCRFLVIMGTWNDLRQGNPMWKYNRGKFEATKARVEGGIAAILERTKVSVLWVKDPEEWVHWVKVFIKRIERGPVEWQRPIETRKGPDRTVPEAMEDCVCSLTGVGRKAGAALIERFSTPSGVCAASVQELTEVLGKRAIRVYSELHGEPK